MNRSIYRVDPIRDPRWMELVEKHPHATVFHTTGWLKALYDTYGYEPIAFTTSAPSGRLGNGLVFCRVRSWLTGDRMVSLPFSDHCEPLFDAHEDFQFVIDYLQADFEHQNWKYLELHPISDRFVDKSVADILQPAKLYYVHLLDLRSDLDRIFRRLHRNSVQHRIKRAERAGLGYERGNSDKLVREFYALLLSTRARRSLPSPPFAWFQNPARSMGNALEIRLAQRGRISIAAIMRLQFRNTVNYKYGGSDLRFEELGATPYLLWKVIEESKAEGALEFDLGRSPIDNSSLIAFKDCWTTRRFPLSYWRFPASDTIALREARKSRLAKTAFARMPKQVN